MELRAQNKVTGASANRLRPTFDVPVDLTTQQHPPLVVLVVVRVVGGAWWMKDDEGLNVVAQHQRSRPRTLAGIGGRVGQKLVQASV